MRTSAKRGFGGDKKMKKPHPRERMGPGVGASEALQPPAAPVVHHRRLRPLAVSLGTGERHCATVRAWRQLRSIGDSAIRRASISGATHRGSIASPSAARSRAVRRERLRSTCRPAVS